MSTDFATYSRLVLIFFTIMISLTYTVEGGYFFSMYQNNE